MNSFSDYRSEIWLFLESYGWLIVFVLLLGYVIYRKHFHDLIEAKKKERKLAEQKKFDRHIQDKYEEKIRFAREKQQKEYNEKEKLERARRVKRENEENARKLKELNELKKTFQTVGRYSTPAPISSPSVSTKNAKKEAAEIIDAAIHSSTIVVLGRSTCPDFRKVCQLVSSYRMETAEFQVFEFDKQPDWPVEKVLEEMENRFLTRKSPFVFICGEFIGGLEETRSYDKNHGLINAKSIHQE